MDYSNLSVGARRPTARAHGCESYFPGHVPHWIQGKKAASQTPSGGILVGLEDDYLVVEYLDRTARYRNHAARTVFRLAKPRSKVWVVERFRILGYEKFNGLHSAASIALEGDEWHPCIPPDPAGPPDTPEGLAERLETHGGFVVPGAALGGPHGR